MYLQNKCSQQSITYICVHTSEHYLISVSHLFVVQPEILILTLELRRTIQTRRQRSQKVIQLITKKYIQTGSVTGCWNTGIVGIILRLNCIRGLDTSACWRRTSTKQMQLHPRKAVFNHEPHKRTVHFAHWC